MLYGMDAKLSQLSTIQTSIHDINQRLDSMDKRILDIEQSTVFVSEKYDDLKKTSACHSSELSTLKTTISSLQNQNSTLNSSYNKLNHELIDLKCRSMRDNLRFLVSPNNKNLHLLVKRRHRPNPHLRRLIILSQKTPTQSLARTAVTKRYHFVKMF